MKFESTLIVAAASLLVGGLSAFAQGAVVERGPHHQILQRLVEETRPDGTVASRVSTIVELETGMNYWDGNAWKESRAEIEIINGVAAARHGPHQVIFEANLKTAGAIDFLTPDGKRFRSTIIGLAYMDAASGRSVMFAEVKDCNGAVLPPNQVWYQDAFEGDCVADVRMTYTKAGFEQDVIFRTAPPSPVTYGLNPATTHVAIYTEFIEAPAAEMRAIVLKQETDPIRRRQMAEPDIIDQELDFGAVKISAGQAFPLTDGDEFERASVPTFKSWEHLEGRLFLIERVEYPEVRSHLQTLPQQAAVKRPHNVFDASKDRQLLARMVPPAPNGPRRRWTDNQYAKVEARRPGFVIDYTALSANLTNYTFVLTTRS